jgi:hypothetical protein
MGLVSIFYQTVGAVEHTILEEQLRGWASQKKQLLRWIEEILHHQKEG